MMRWLPLSLCLSLSALSSAFTVQKVDFQPRWSVITELASTNENDEAVPSRRDFVRFFGAAGVVSAFGLVAASEASTMDGSSIMISDAIKTMDMGLPSYGSISGSKITSEALQSLTNEYVPPKELAEVPRKVKEKVKSEGNPMGAVLPSMNKSVKKPPPSVKSAPVAEPKEEKAPATKYEFVDMGLPSYSEGTTGKKKSAFSL